MNVTYLDAAHFLNAINSLPNHIPFAAPTMVNLDDKRFTIYDRTNKSNMLKINKIDLSCVTATPPVLTNYLNTDLNVSTASMIDRRFDASNTFNNGVLNSSNTFVVDDPNPLTKMFNVLMWFIGLTTLKLEDVDLSVIDNVLTVDIKRSVWFTGTLKAIF